MRSEYSGVGREVILVEAVFHGGAEATSAAALLRALDPLRSMTAPGRHGYPPPCLLIHADESQTVVFDHLAIELRVNEGIALVAMRLSVLSDREKLDRVVAGVPRLNDAGSAPRVTPPVAGPGVNGLAAGDATDVLTHAQAVLDRPGGDVGDLDQWLARLDRRPVSEAADALHAAAIQHGPIADSTQTVLSDWKEKLDSRTEHWVQAFSKKLPAGLTETVRQQLSVSLQQGMYDALKRAFESIKEEILAAERHPILEEAKSAADGIKRAYESSVKSATEAWSAEANDASQEGAGSQPVGKPPSDPAKARMEQAREISAQRVISQNREEEMRHQIRAIAVQVEKAASVLASV